MSRYYIIPPTGKRVYFTNKRDATAAALKLANTRKRGVTVYEDTNGMGWGGSSTARVLEAHRNPVKKAKTTKSAYDKLPFGDRMKLSRMAKAIGKNTEWLKTRTEQWLKHQLKWAL